MDMSFEVEGLAELENQLKHLETVGQKKSSAKSCPRVCQTN